MIDPQIEVHSFHVASADPTVNGYRSFDDDSPNLYVPDPGFAMSLSNRLAAYGPRPGVELQPIRQPSGLQLLSHLRRRAGTAFGQGRAVGCRGDVELSFLNLPGCGAPGR